MIFGIMGGKASDLQTLRLVMLHSMAVSWQCLEFLWQQASHSKEQSF